MVAHSSAAATRVHRRMQILSNGMGPSMGAALRLAAAGVSASAAPFKKLLIANRGEIALRIHRAAKALGVPTVAVYAAEDKGSLHVDTANENYEVFADKAAGPIAPYLSIEEMIRVALEAGCDAIHPGYGFLSESAPFSAACAAAGIKFVGPSSDSILLFGDKVASKNLAVENQVPVTRGSGPLDSPEAAVAFVSKNNVPYPILIKAVFGGGGRGQRVVRTDAELLQGFKLCVDEATMAFGNGACFVEEYLENVRHVEVQILADGQGNVSHVYARDCSVQLRNQKAVEIAPPRDMAPALLTGLTECAVKLARAAKYENAGTVEFLVKGALSDPSSRFIFLEMNPRIQVEHTITEQICNINLVQSQILVASGKTLSELGLTQDKISPPQGFSIQARICLMPGSVKPLSVYREPAGEGLRVDSAVCLGRTPSPQFDPMFAKLVVSVPAGQSFQQCVDKTLTALDNFELEGVSTNIHFLKNILEHADFEANEVVTSFVSTNQAALFSKKKSKKKKKGKKSTKVKKAKPAPVLQKIELKAPFPGMVANVHVVAGADCVQGGTLVVINAMKMLNEVCSPLSGKVLEVRCEVDKQVNEGDVLMVLEGYAVAEDEEDDDDDDDSAVRGGSTGGGGGRDGPRSSDAWLQEGASHGAKASTSKLRTRIKKTSDKYLRNVKANEARLKELHERLAIVSKGGGGKYEALHRKRGKMLPRERIDAIIDPGTKFLELSALAAWEMYGGKIHSAAMITGIGVVHGQECMFLANDATVKGGVFWPVTGKKQLRAQHIAQENRLPCIYLVDGGGANLAGGGMTAKKKENWKQASGAAFVDGGLQFKNQAVMSSMQIPQISAVLGKCTAGGAYIPAMSDESIIVKGNGTIYLGGPPLVKAATGEDADEQELGGALMHTRKSGVADHLAETEEEALKKVRWVVEHLSPPRKHHLPRLPSTPPAYDPNELLGIIPEDNKFPFEVREVIARIVDGSRFHEFKARYGPTLVCGFAHIHGYPVGILANNGMLFSDSAIKGAHFVQVCGQRGIPLIFLHNITGFMVGTQYEQGGIAKDGAKMIMAVSCVNVPKFSVVLAGSHGAGNYAMCGPAFDPRFTFLWPNAKISVMGGQQAADVITIVKDAQRARNGEPPLPDAMKKMIQAPIVKLFESTNSAYDSTRLVHDDGIIDPRDTRDVLGMAISISLNKPFKRGHYGVFRM